MTFILGILGCSLLLALAYSLLRRGDALAERAEKASRLIDAFARDIQSSPHCCAAFVQLLGEGKHCECFKCRKERGESVTEESQALSETMQAEAAHQFTLWLNSGVSR